MQIEPEVFLKLTEAAQRLVFLDIEATGLRGDYNSVLCVSMKPYGGEPVSFSISQPGNDKKVVREVGEWLDENADAIVTYYGKGFDIPMLNTRRLRWSLPPLQKRPHIDMYYTLKYNLLTARKSQGHLLSWLEAPEQKMAVGADVWNQVLSDTKKAMVTMIERCESDAAGLEGLYERTKHLIRDIKKG